MKPAAALVASFVAVTSLSCSPPEAMEGFQYRTEKFADLMILRYRVPGFDELTLQQKKLLYFLYQASLSGREIIYDQNYRHNLRVRRTLEAIVQSYAGARSTAEFQELLTYAKRVWFSNGIHHHYSKRKFLPGVSPEYFAKVVRGAPGGTFPLKEGESLDDLISELTPIVFDPELDAKGVDQRPGADLVADSANNYYSGLTQAEVEAYYARVMDPDDATPISYGLNSQLAERDGVPVERIWKSGGMYGEAIERIVHWLEQAASVAENEQQATALSKLIDFYTSGDLAAFDDYSIAWVGDTGSKIDLISGFIETYGDAMGFRGGYEAVLSFRDAEATRRIEAIGSQAQWFEDSSPIMDEHRRPEVKGISARVITVVVTAGDTSPSAPIGINLPNANWIRSNHGSKSVTLGNLIDAHSEATKQSGALEAFAWSQDEIDRGRRYGTLADSLHTDMHEVIGHASGRLVDGVATPKETLKNYADPLEEARADLVALYFAMDDKLVEIGVMPSLEVGRAMYDDAIRNGLVWQLRRLELGENLEEAHMRSRQLVAGWAYQQGQAEGVIARRTRDGRSYFVIEDYGKLRELFGQLLREVQRIISERDYQAGRDLVESYGVQVDRELHAEVLERYRELDLAPFSGFINPRLVPVMRDGEIADVNIEYPDDFTQQMLEYARDYSFLPNAN